MKHAVIVANACIRCLHTLGLQFGVDIPRGGGWAEIEIQHGTERQ
jgi:hypothetical protein